MVREYIGARYVPKFTGPYDASQSYEALCVVDNGAGTTYITKIPTPAGTPLTDSTHWQVYGASTGAILDLQNRVDTLETDIADIPVNRVVLLIGDSYVAGVGGAGTTIESVMESITDWDVRSYAQQGCGYLRVNSGKKMIDVVQDAINATSDKELVTDVVLAASVYNDSGMSSDPTFIEASFVAALENINTLVKANLPNARITVIPALWTNYKYYSAYTNIFEWTMSGAMKIGANFANNSIDWLIAYPSSVDSGDNIHPSAAGYQILAGKIASVINGAQASIYSGGVDSVLTATNDYIYFRYYPDHVHISGTIAREAGQTFTSLFDVPQPLQKLMNFPIWYNAYGSNETKSFLITGATVYAPSAWFNEGQNYCIECDVPYFR